VLFVARYDVMDQRVEGTFLNLFAEECLVAVEAVSFLRNSENNAQSYSGSKRDVCL
jgi:hypothetical protein